VNYFFRATNFTFHLAAPMERAVTSFHHINSLSPIATAAAHEVAAVDADAGVVASPPVCARDAEPRVLLAEARRGLQVHKVFRPRRLVVRIVGP
jgi:hypothetical protein